MEEEATDSLRARDIGALTTLGSFVPTDKKRRKWQYVSVGYLGQIALRRAAMLHDA
jgi:hypothetical protein